MSEKKDMGPCYQIYMEPHKKFRVVYCRDSQNSVDFGKVDTLEECGKIILKDIQ